MEELDISESTARRHLTELDAQGKLIKKMSMSHSAKRYVLCDSSKFSQISCVKFGDFTNAVIITTKVEDKEYAHCENIVEVKEQ